jgi:hypothetical protein
MDTTNVTSRDMTENDGSPLPMTSSSEAVDEGEEPAGLEKSAGFFKNHKKPLESDRFEFKNHRIHSSLF